MGLNWYDIAQPDDVRAQDFYGELLVAKAEAHSWINSWLLVPDNVLAQLRRSPYAEDTVDSLWTGLEWVDVFSYETQGRVYIRLPRTGEITE